MDPLPSSSFADENVRQVPENGLRPYIVVGGGPAGARAAQEIARRSDRRVVLFSDEKWGYYNRIKLTPLLAKEVNLGQVRQSLDLDTGDQILRLDGRRIASIDSEKRIVIEHGSGVVWPYEKLVLATGSRARRPVVPGVELPGVFTLRGLDDVEALLARTLTARHVVIIGGGLLGLEAARGMHARGVDVTVLEHNPHPMARQLDLAGGALLQEKIEALGVRMRAAVSVRQILGTMGVEGVSLATGELIACDTIILCTGVLPNREIALDSGLKVGRGVTVDASMRTSDPHIYAVGECAEFNQFCEGLVAPGLEQARIAAENITGGAAEYARTKPTVKLKVAGAQVFSAGDVDQIDDREDIGGAVFAENAENDEGVYRRLVTRRGRLIGALGVGAWEEAGRVQQAVAEQQRISSFQLRRFRKTGRLYEEGLPDNVELWPAASTVCNCTGVTRGQLGDAISGGCKTVACLAQATSASTVCGTCQPLLVNLLEAESGAPVAREPARFWMALLGLSAAALIGALLYAMLPTAAPAQSFTTAFTFDKLWTDGLFKQITGYTLLGVSVLTVLLSVRKRITRIDLGDFAIWRVIHIGLGLLAVGVLVAHSGFSMGENLNFALITSFVTTIVVGALGGAIIGAEHRLEGTGVLRALNMTPRTLALWLHILACWPLPLLLIIHIVSVYAY